MNREFSTYPQTRSQNAAAAAYSGRFPFESGNLAAGVSNVPGNTSTAGVSKAPSNTSTAGVSKAPSNTSTAGVSKAPSNTSTAGVSKAPSNTSTAGVSKAPSNTSTAGVSNVVSNTSTAGVSDASSNTSTAGVSNAPSNTSTAGVSNAPSNTSTAGVSNAPSNTSTAGVSNAPSNTPTAGVSNAPSNTSTAGVSDAPSNTSTAGVSNAPSNTSTAGVSDAPSNSNTNAAGVKASQSNTSTAGATQAVEPNQALFEGYLSAFPLDPDNPVAGVNTAQSNPSTAGAAQAAKPNSALHQSYLSAFPLDPDNPAAHANNPDMAVVSGSESTKKSKIESAKAAVKSESEDTKSMGGCLALPYPPPTAACPNARNACIISALYAGRCSELTAVMQYFYDSIWFECLHADLHEMFTELALCKMRHLKMLGKLLCSLGAKPKFRSCDGVNCACPGGWWSPKPPVIRYERDLRVAILENIAGEKQAISDYRCAIQLIDDANIQALLLRIIMDKEHHIALFDEMYRRFAE